MGPDWIALCAFSREAPSQWPFGHIWIRIEEYERTAVACADPEHPLHWLARYTMCEGCERELVWLVRGHVCMP